MPPAIPGIKLKAQKNEIQYLKKAYEYLDPVGSEHKTSSEKLSYILNTTHGVSARFASILEELEILERKYTWESSQKTAIWKLLVPFNDALQVLKISHAVNNDPASLKKRILKVLADEGGTISSIKTLSIKLGKNGGSTDAHNLTHILHSMQRENLIDFAQSTSKSKIPYNIKLLKADIKAPQVISLAPTISAPVSAEPEIVNFPLIQKLISRKEWLREAAYLAEKAGEEDIAIMLDDRMAKPFSPFEEEVIMLYEAYMKK